MKSQKFFFGLRIALFSCILIVGCVVGFLLFLRPTFSESEKRDLTPFPAFTVDTFLSGEWTEQVSLWYADTFPGREALLSVNDRIRSLYGLRTSEANSNGRGDEIPEDESIVWRPDETVTDDPAGEESDHESETEGRNAELIEGYYVDAEHATAYELYYFHKDIADRYAHMVVNAAYKLDGVAQVYDMVVPLSYCFGMDPTLVSKIGASDGIAAIDYMYRSVNSLSDQAGLQNPVVTLDVTGVLGEHYDEYLYFRTDHHWTGKGAYYASRVFLDEVRRPYPALREYDTYEFHNFWGSLYSHTKSDSLYNAPDTIYAWASRTVDHVTITTRDGEILERPLIQPDTESMFSVSARYRCFVDGDYPLYEIHNDTITDGSRILVIKESYGNAFIPMLADSYEYVWAIDYRFSTESLVQFVTDHDIDTVLFVNNLVATGDEYTVSRMERLVNR